jgi:hypothetical protein
MGDPVTYARQKTLARILVRSSAQSAVDRSKQRELALPYGAAL